MGAREGVEGEKKKGLPINQFAGFAVPAGVKIAILNTIKKRGEVS